MEYQLYKKEKWRAVFFPLLFEGIKEKNVGREASCYAKKLWLISVTEANIL